MKDIMHINLDKNIAKFCIPEINYYPKFSQNLDLPLSEVNIRFS